MSRYRYTLMLASGLLLLHSIGCTHTRLRRSSVYHGRTVADVHTQQVLDNLAKFVKNPGALPHFAYPAGGSSQITDDLRTTPGFSFSPSRLTGWTLGFSGSRNDRQAFTMQPINDPRKLELMRCAYQRVVRGGCPTGDGSCPNCNFRFNDFYLGKEIPGKTKKKTFDGYDVYALLENGNPTFIEIYKTTDMFNDTIYRYVDDGQQVDPNRIKEADSVKQLYVPNSVSVHTQRTGKITSSCLQCGWFKCGKKCDIPSCNSCCLTGQYCGTYVWVPECHRDELTKLTLVILDIAINDPAELPATPTREVTALLNSTGGIAASRKDGVYRVRQTISASKSASTVQKFRDSKKSKLNLDADALIKHAHEALQLAIKTTVAANKTDNALRLEALEALPDDALFQRLSTEDMATLSGGDQLLESVLEAVKQDLQRANDLRQQANEIPTSALPRQSNADYVDPAPIQRRTDTPGTNLLLNQLRLETLTPQ